VFARYLSFLAAREEIRKGHHRWGTGGIIGTTTIGIDEPSSELAARFYSPITNFLGVIVGKTA